MREGWKWKSFASNPAEQGLDAKIGSGQPDGSLENMFYLPKFSGLPARPNKKTSFQPIIIADKYLKFNSLSPVYQFFDYF